MRPRARLVVAALAATIVFPVFAEAKIEIHDSEGQALLGTIEKGKCKLQGRRPDRNFLANARSTDRAYGLQVGIPEGWRGFNADYPLLYGGESPYFNLIGGGQLFGNYAIPGTPPGIVGGGAISFSRNHKKLSIGFAPAPNADYSQAVVISGAMKCKYPR